MRLSLLAAFAALLLALSPAVPAPSVEAASCQFVLGFKALHDAIPDAIGNCRVDQSYSANGDATQATDAWHGKGGLLVWRKADNWTAFTDGANTWINGPYGVQKRANSERFPWENDGSDSPVQQATAATPTPAPQPTFNYYVETSVKALDVRPGGAQTICARLSAEGAPPTFGDQARLVWQGSNYIATTQQPDGNACVTVTIPINAKGCSFEAYITHDGKEINEPSWAHREWCHVLPY